MRPIISTLAVVVGLVNPIAARADDVTLSVAGRAAGTPGIAASGSTVAVAFAGGAGGAGDIFVAMSQDGGRTFASPVRVNTVTGEARISGEIAPRVSITPRAGGASIVSVTWNAKDGGAQIKTARSTDGGKTFGPAIALQSSGAAGDRGWQAAATDAGGRLHAIWLDHRGLAAAGTHDLHKGEHDGAAMAQKSGLYYWGGGPERELFKGVCYCCKTALAIAPGGAIYAAWRHVFEGNFRDIAFTRSTDGGKTFAPMQRVNQDGWQIDGCPDDGPALAVDGAGVVHLVWPTVSHDRGVILYATSRDGKTFSKPVRVPTFGTPKASHPQVAVDGAGGVTIAWDEVRDGARTAGVVDVTATGFGTPRSLGGASMYPVMAGAGSGLVAAWTAGAPGATTITVRRLR